MSLSEKKVLILDDSSVVLSTVSGILSKIGFNDKNILFSQKPKAGVTICRRDDFDVVICDFNFNQHLNGKQILEELLHYECLKDNSSFILITGDSTQETFNSLLEMSIDDYILKPFNYEILKERLVKTIKKRQSLQSIYTLKRQKKYEEAVKVCDELSVKYPAYKMAINREKGIFLRLLKRWGQATELYKELYFSSSHDWVKLGLANALKNSGDLDKARKLVSFVLSQKPDSIDAKKEMASIEVLTNNIPASITQLIDVNKLTRGCSERELIISNLSTYIDDFENSYYYYKRFRDVNQETYRKSIWLDINYLRRNFQFISSSHSNSKLKIELKKSQGILNDLYKTNDDFVKINLDFLMSHLMMILGNYSEAVVLFQDAYKRAQKADEFDFYDLVYLSWLFLHFSYDSYFISFIPMMKESYFATISRKSSKSHSESLLESLNLLNSKSIRCHEEKVEWLQHQKDAFGSSDKGDLILNYINISRVYPTLVSIRINIVRLLSDVWPCGYGRFQVDSLIQDCDKVIRAFTNPIDLKSLSYDALYKSALEAINNSQNR